MPWLPILKIAITLGVILGANNLMKRDPWMGALLLSLPLTSLLALSFTWHDTQDQTLLASSSMDIFYLVIPSLAFFPIFAKLIQHMRYYPALGLALCGMLLAYTLCITTIPSMRRSIFAIAGISSAEQALAPEADKPNDPPRNNP